MISYAQNGEDVILARALGATENGFYVDVGAASPTEATVTRHFYEAGWHGINLEPVPGWAAALRALRPRDVTIEAAAGAAAGEIVFYEVLDDAALSTGDGESADRLRRDGHELREVRVPVVTLDAVLEEHGPERIDFLKIDVEGAEADVLAGIDLRRFRPRVVLVEATEPNSLRPAYGAWEELVTSRGYRYASTDGINRYYVRDEDAALAELLVPVNSLDEAVPMREQLLQDEIARLRTYVHSLEATRDGLDRRVDALGDEIAELHERRRPGARVVAGSPAPVAPVPPPERIAVLSAPGTGGLALAAALGRTLGCLEAVALHPADLRLEAAGERAVVHLPWPRRAHLQQLLRRHAFQVVTVGRHPFDILCAALRLISAEPRASEWLGSSDAAVIAGCSPSDPVFLEWAAGERGRALVEVSASWWREPGVVRVRFEQWRVDPAGVVAALWRLLHPAGPAPPALPEAGDLGLEEVPGGWRRYLTAEAAERLAGAHEQSCALFGVEVSTVGLPGPAAAARAWAEIAAGPTLRA